MIKIRHPKTKPRGRKKGDAKCMIQPSNYPKVLKMYEEGYSNSMIGNEFRVTGTTIGRILKKYKASLEVST